MTTYTVDIDALGLIADAAAWIDSNKLHITDARQIKLGYRLAHALHNLVEDSAGADLNLIYSADEEPQCGATMNDINNIAARIVG